MRKVPLINGEIYHIYNRGVDKRIIFDTQDDVDRFYEGVVKFNTEEPIGSLYQQMLIKNQKFRCRTPKRFRKLVNIICYCLNPNHYHLLLEQLIDDGISEYRKRIGGGYTNYYNAKNKRSGALFQGKFKSAHVSNDNQLQSLCVYINLNNKVHRLSDSEDKTMPIKSKSSWAEYMGESKENICEKDFILGKNKDSQKYKDFATAHLQELIDKKNDEKEFHDFFLE